MLGDRLKEERERLKLTIPELAAMAGAKKSTVIDWQNGVSSPPAAKLAELANVGVDVLYVLTGVRSIAVPGMSEDQIGTFNDLVRSFWEISAEARARTMAVLDALVLKELQDQGHTRSIRRREHGSEPKGTNTTKVTAKGKGTIAIGSIHGGTQTIKPSKA